MKRLASISLSMLFVIQLLVLNMDMCCELQKLPAFINHYQQHKAFEGDSFFEFIAQDYVHHDGDHDEKEHDDLPFHGQHHCQHGPVYLTQHFTAIRLDMPSFLLVSEGCMYVFSISSEYPDDMIRPPQG